jgi:hypothetical protein
VKSLRNKVFPSAEGVGAGGSTPNMGYPGTVRDGSPALAECTEPRCDVYFDYAFTDVYVARS